MLNKLYKYNIGKKLEVEISKSMMYFISVYTIIIFTLAYSLANFYFKHNSTMKIVTINYPITSQISINAENWFYKYNGGASADIDFVRQTCEAIDQGYYTFEWDYQTTCNKVTK